jgi:hypothetical protein
LTAKRLRISTAPLVIAGCDELLTHQVHPVVQTGQHPPREITR